MKLTGYEGLDHTRILNKAKTEEVKAGSIRSRPSWVSTPVSLHLHHDKNMTQLLIQLVWH